MGFQVPRRTGNLKFGEEYVLYAGAEVKVHLDAPMALLFQITDKEDSEDQDGLQRAVDLFAEHILISWNLEDQVTENDPPVAIPATVEGMATQPLRFGLACINAWTEGVSGPPSPLEMSPNGSALAAASTPVKAGEKIEGTD